MFYDNSKSPKSYISLINVPPASEYWLFFRETYIEETAWCILYVQIIYIGGMFSAVGNSEGSIVFTEK